MPFAPFEYHRPYAVGRSGRVLACAGAAPPPTGQQATALSERYLSWANGSLLQIRSTIAGPSGRRRAPAKVRSIALTRRFVYVTAGSGTSPRAHRARLRVR
jgi:hypothetical protein